MMTAARMQDGPAYSLAVPAVRCIGNCAAGGSGDVVQLLQSLACLQALSCCLDSQEPGLAQEAAWALGNLAAGPRRWLP